MNTVLFGDVRQSLQSCPPALFHCVMTSPPYWNLRSYLKSDDPLKALEIGSERTPQEFVETMVGVFREVRRVLRDDGVLFVNLGDSYNDSGKFCGSAPSNMTSKQRTNPHSQGTDSVKVDGIDGSQQLLMPHRVAMAMQADGWILRSTIIWAKKSPMPESLSGWRFRKCRIKISRDEYEAMQNVRPVEAPGSVRRERGEVQAVRECGGKAVPSERCLPCGSAEVQEQRQGNQDGEVKGSEAGREGEATGVLPVTCGTCEAGCICKNSDGPCGGKKGDGQVSQDGTRKRAGEDSRQKAIATSDAPREDAGGLEALPQNAKGQASQQDKRRDPTPANQRNAGIGTADLASVGSDIDCTAEQVLLVQGQGGDDPGSCDPSQQGRTAHGDECCGRLPEVQHKQRRKDQDFVLIDCPGCEKCLPNGGLVLRRGKWRPTTAHEYVFMFSKSDKYFADGDAVQEAVTGGTHSRGTKMTPPKEARGAAAGNGHDGWCVGTALPVETRNPRSVWFLSSEPYKAAHFATFPTELARRCIAAATSKAGCCADCGSPFAPVVVSERVPTRPGIDNQIDESGMSNRDPQRHVARTTTTGYRPTCKCGADSVPCRVLDPFGGSGTVGQVAKHLGSDYVLCELNREYLPLIEARVNTLPRWKVKANGKPKKATAMPSQPVLFQ